MKKLEIIEQPLGSFIAVSKNKFSNKEQESFIGFLPCLRQQHDTCIKLLKGYPSIGISESIMLLSCDKPFMFKVSTGLLSMFRTLYFHLFSFYMLTVTGKLDFIKITFTYLPASIRMLQLPEGLELRIRMLVLSLLFLLPSSAALVQTWENQKSFDIFKKSKQKFQTNAKKARKNY